MSQNTVSMTHHRLRLMLSCQKRKFRSNAKQVNNVLSMKNNSTRKVRFSSRLQIPIVKLKCDANGKNILCIFVHLLLAVVAAFASRLKESFQFSKTWEERSRNFSVSFTPTHPDPGRSPSLSCSFTSYQSLRYVTLLGISSIYTGARRKKVK